MIDSKTLVALTFSLRRGLLAVNHFSIETA
jgi:hypothetical protein